MMAAYENNSESYARVWPNNHFSFVESFQQMNWIMGSSISGASQIGSISNKPPVPTRRLGVISSKEVSFCQKPQHGLPILLNVFCGS